MFVVFILQIDVVVLAYCPVEICCSFVVSSYVFCLGNFRSTVFEIARKFCTLGRCHLSESCFVVVGLNALTRFGSNNEAFCF